jgi:hypothetical protein
MELMMKKRFLSLCLIVPMMCSAPALYSQDGEEQDVWAQVQQERGIEQEPSAVKMTGVYPRVHQELVEVFQGPRLQVMYEESVPLEDAPHLRLEDQSVWQVNTEDRSNLDGWRPGHVLSVQPNHAWFHDKKFPFVIHNLNTENAVAVKVKIYCDRQMRTMPSLKRLIPGEQQIVLEHGTRWFVKGSDFGKVFERWQEGDVIMFGLDHGWFSSFNVLLNLTKKDYCHAAWIR